MKKTKSASKKKIVKSSVKSVTKNAIKPKARATTTRGKIATQKTNLIKQSFEKIAEQITNLFKSRPKDTSAAIKMDHEALRNFLGLLKDTGRDMTERRRAYDAFSSLLKSHTKAEEQIIYKTADKMAGKEMHIKVAEGYVEHHVADDLMKRIEATSETLEWSAHANVLAEVVEHHLKEEERDLLPLIQKSATAKVDMDMLVDYLAVRAETQDKVTEKNIGSLEMLKS